LGDENLKGIHPLLLAQIVEAILGQAGGGII
jgi:hypothetical protein